MNFVVTFALSALSGALVAVGLFLHVSGIIRQKRNFKGVLTKLLGLIPLFFAIFWDRHEIVWVSLIFFGSASIFLIFLTLARNKLLR